MNDLFFPGENVGLVAVGKVAEIVKGPMLYFAGDDQSLSLKVLPIFRCVLKLGAFPTLHAAPIELEGEKAFLGDFDVTAHRRLLNLLWPAL